MALAYYALMSLLIVYFTFLQRVSPLPASTLGILLTDHSEVPEHNFGPPK